MPTLSGNGDHPAGPHGGSRCGDIFQLVQDFKIRRIFMSPKVHPNEALFAGEKPFPIIPSCEHFAGSEKLITKALELQNTKGGVFDITMDCEDGAPTGKEKEHAEMIVAMLKSPLNKHKMSGVRVHDFTNPHWQQDVRILVEGAVDEIAYITIPKPTKADQVKSMISYIQ